jgi:thiamine-phosphate pyrophosphorylase
MNDSLCESQAKREKRGCDMRARLAQSRLYVLLDGRDDVSDFHRLAAILVESQVDVIQFRDKRLADRQLLERARRLREVTRGTKTLFIMNDRPDLALLADADGVHVGQEEFQVPDVRRLVGDERLVGVSTHTIEQARQAAADRADYLGCGPTFPSKTKEFSHFSGLEFLKQVAGEVNLPCFAIGGIHVENLGGVFETGFRRIAVGASVVKSPDPRKSAKQLLAVLGKVAP